MPGLKAGKTLIGKRRNKFTRANMRRFNQNRKAGTRRLRKEAVILEKIIDGHAKLALLMINVIKEYNVYNDPKLFEDTLFSTIFFRNVLFQMMLKTTDDLHMKFIRAMPSVYTQLEVLVQVTAVQFYILVAEKLDSEGVNWDANWDTVYVDSGNTSALQVVSNYSDMLGKTCLALSYGARCVGRTNIGECLEMAQTAAGTLATVATAANTGFRAHGHFSGTHPIADEHMISSLVLPSLKIGSALANTVGLERVSQITGIPNAVSNAQETYEAIEQIPANFKNQTELALARRTAGI
jgi:hypothetical protein